MNRYNSYVYICIQRSVYVSHQVLEKEIEKLEETLKTTEKRYSTSVVIKYAFICINFYLIKLLYIT